jgi:hypothetical protein
MSAPHAAPALHQHPEFPLMLLAALERFRCTLADVREDYWLLRTWRALAADPALAGRVARVGIGDVLLTAPGYGAMPADRRLRAHWCLHVHERLAVECGRATDLLRIGIGFAEEPVEVGEACVRSLLAQALVEDARWTDLGRYVLELDPVIVPVAYLIRGIQAA